jgi:hypothetical protein
MFLEQDRVDVDCRYNPGAKPPPEAEGAGWVNEFLPQGDVVRPLTADPKQPQVFGIIQSTRVLGAKTTNAVGSVAFGENFGLWSRRKTDSCDGVQVGLLTGVFSQFDLLDPATQLVNTDFVIGIPVSWRTDYFSGRVRLYHQSSHLGDEFLLSNPAVNRVDLSFEELEGILSLNTPNGWGRVYAGAGYLLHREPATLDRLKVQWGVELRGPEIRSPLFGAALRGGLIVTPILAADFKTFEELGWQINTNLLGGLEWFKAGTTRRLRLLFSYYNGYNPYGQFFAQKIQNIGFGLYLVF